MCSESGHVHCCTSLQKVCCVLEITGLGLLLYISSIKAEDFPFFPEISTCPSLRQLLGSRWPSSFGKQSSRSNALRDSVICLDWHGCCSRLHTWCSLMACTRHLNILRMC